MNTGKILAITLALTVIFTATAKARSNTESGADMKATGRMTLSNADMIEFNVRQAKDNQPAKGEF